MKCIRQLNIRLAFSMLLFTAKIATAGNFSVNGYYKSFFIAFDSPEIEGATKAQIAPAIGAVTNRIRVNIFYKLNGWITVSSSYDLIPRVQDRSLFAGLPNAAGFAFPVYRFGDLERWIYPEDVSDARSFGISQNLDRVSFTVHAPFADVFIGRQAIAWGSAKVINPTDVLTPFSFDELDTEDRKGVDAVRVRVPIGFMGELDAGYVAGDDFAFDESAFYLRGRTYITRTDVSGLVVAFRENLLIGLDVSRSIRGAGFWLESAYVFANAFDDSGEDSANGYFRASLGLDYALTPTLYGFLEYHFSQAGTGNPDEFITQLGDPAFTDGAVYLLGTHYLTPGVTYQFTPLVIGNAQALIALSDPSVLLAPQVEYNAAQNIYLAAGAFIGIGKGPRIENAGGGVIPSMVLGSEFGGYSDLYYMSFRIYF